MRGSLAHLRLEGFYPLMAAALVLGVFALRLPFMTRTLYAFDSANYALAVRDYYNVAHHRPHPPGYPVYVAFGRAIDLLTHDANRALIIEGIAFSALAVGCTIALARLQFGRVAGLLAGGLLLFTVGFWGYGEVAYPYVALAGETASLALLTQWVLAGRRWLVVPMGLVWAIWAGVRWDASVFCIPLWVWALWSARSWRLRGASVGLAGLVVLGWALPMIQLTGGWDIYRQALSDYLQVWSPQSAYVVGDFSSGGETQATYNVNFLVNYLRQMLGIGLLLVLYLLGRRFGPAALATDQRSRLLTVWVVPPLVAYVFAHLGEPGYVLSLAPQAAILSAVGMLDLGSEAALLSAALRGRGWAWLPSSSRALGLGVTALLALVVMGWNVQAFVRGVGPGRLPDLRTRDLTTTAQIDFLRQQPAEHTLVLAHDILRQLEFYLPTYRVELLYSEYVPDWDRVHARTDVGAGIDEVVVLDTPLQVPPEDAGRVHEVVLNDQPRVSVAVVDVRGARAIERGYRYVHVVTR